MRPSPAGGGLRAGRAWVFRALLVLLCFVSGAPLSRYPRLASAPECGPEISHPLLLRVLPQTSPGSGQLLTARIEVEARVPVEGLSLRLRAPREVQILTPIQGTAGSLGPGTAYAEEITLRVADRERRRTVEVTVEANIDGVPVPRSAILNLPAARGEDVREIVTPDGRRLREVAATRIGS